MPSPLAMDDPCFSLPLDYLWENPYSNEIAETFTQVTPQNFFKAPESPSSRRKRKKRTAKSVLLPRGTLDGRPPLAPVSSNETESTLSWDESVETILSPQSVDSVRLLLVSESNDLVDVYECPTVQHEQPLFDVIHKKHYLTFTYSDIVADGLCASSVSSNPSDEESLVGLRFLDCTCGVSDELSEFPSLVRLDLDFVHQDPPKPRAVRLRPRQTSDYFY